VRTLVLERHVPARSASVYAAWTEVDLLARWWWPMLPDTEYVVDARVGGLYRMASNTAGFGVHGQFTTVDPARRLVMTWCWEDGADRGPIEIVTVDFVTNDVADPPGTTVTVTHPCSDIDNLEQGWTHVLDRLVAFADQLP
jgi:uncharacterized protein YndB with AHSA1/START domain